jgi:hypothetical protein
MALTACARDAIFDRGTLTEDGRMPVVEIDCTHRTLGPGIRIAPCPQFAGWCIEAMRRFVPDELVHRYPLHIIGPETEVRFLTDLGVRACNPDHTDRYRRMTHQGQRCFVLAFDDLLNHSQTANTQFVLSTRAPHTGELYTLRAIGPGEELTVDHRTFYGSDWKPPAP